MLISTGPVLAAGAFPPPQAASSKLAVSRTNSNFFMLLSFLEIEFDDCRQVVRTVRVKALGQGAIERYQLEDRKIQNSTDALGDARGKGDLGIGLAQAQYGAAQPLHLGENSGLMRTIGVREQPSHHCALIHHAHRPVPEFQKMKRLAVGEGLLLHLEVCLTGQAVTDARSKEIEPVKIRVLADLL